jgi:class 3 adenylate cyclase
MDRPETQYVAVGDAQVAYQVVGDGPSDLLYCYGLGGHIDAFWETADGARVFGALASCARLIMFDRRGTGASDALPLNAIPTWEELTEDMSAVLAAVGSDRTAVMANLDVGPVAVLFAAMHPEIVSSLVLVNSAARYQLAEDYPVGVAPAAIDALVAMLASSWGTLELASLTNPDQADDPEWIRQAARMLRASATPRAAAAQYDYMLRSVDVRSALALVQTPTLVLHVRDNGFVPLALGQYLAANIEGATFVPLPGANIAYMSDDAIGIVTEFLTGDAPEVEVDRVLTTVLFTDIVGSTQHAATFGDRRWRALLDAHDRAVREQLRRFRGREVNTTGDGFVAAFDGPARAIRCSLAISQATAAMDLPIRAGLHTGECELRGDDLGGLSVHIAARVSALSDPNEVLVSGTVKDLVVGSGIEFIDRGEHELKGVPGSWKLFAVKG